MEGREVEVWFDGRRGAVVCASGWKDMTYCVLGIDAEHCTGRQFTEAVTEQVQGYMFTVTLESGRTSPPHPQWIAQGKRQ